MPAYYICPICKRVPVAKAYDLCEDCRAKAAQQSQDDAKKLAELERKPRGGKSWLQEIGK